MNNVILTPITISEMRQLIREEVEASISKNNAVATDVVENELLTIEETAKYINMAVSSVYGLVHTKRIPYIKRGKRLIFERTKINEWLHAGRQKTREEIEEQALSEMHSFIQIRNRK